MRNSLLYVTIISGCLLICPRARTELATPQEMENVCNNWLTEIVDHWGEWAGESTPQIQESRGIYAGDTLLANYYTISPRGFVVVPVLKEMVPIKAYSDVSLLDERQEGGFLQLLRDVLSNRMQLYSRIHGSLEVPEPANEEAIFGRQQRAAWDRLAVPAKDFQVDKAAALDEAGPLLSSSWHQRSPYNDLCPMGDGGRCVVGCVATAAAQILNYWQWPPSGVGEYSYTWSGDQSCDGNVGGGVLSATYSDTYDWVHMVDSCDDGCSSLDSVALAELNYETGVAFNMNYGACGSGASVSRALTVFPTFFKYSSSIKRESRSDYDQAGWFSLIQEEVNNDRPIQYRINMHSIVCDGWRNQSGQFEYHMNYGWGGSFTTWFVLDSLYCYWIEADSVCPAMEDFMITNIIPQDEPIIELIGRNLDDSGGDADGHADPGETVELSAIVRNSGWDASNATGELSTSDGFISITTSTAAFEATIPWGGESTTQTPFALTVSPSCPDPHIVAFDLDISAMGGYSTTETLYMYVGQTWCFEDDMESGEGYWTHSSVTPSYYDEWHQSGHRVHSGATSWKAGGPDDAHYTDNADGGLVTPPFLLPTYPVLTFWHWMDAEVDSADHSQAWDGSVIMISSGDGSWDQITPEGGYPCSIIDNPASPFEAGTPCFSDSHGWEQEVFDLSAYSGVVQIMFRFGSDGYVTEEGWYVDDVVVYNDACCVNIRGNANGSLDDVNNISDVTYLVEHLFGVPLGPAPVCREEGNANGSEGETINISDITYLVDFLFGVPLGPAPPPCP